MGEVDHICKFDRLIVFTTLRYGLADWTFHVIPSVH